MFSKILFAVALLLALPAHAATVGIGMEQGFPAGFSAQWPGLNLGYCDFTGSTLDGHGSNCVLIPPGTHVVGVYGTETIKAPNAEVLVAVMCGMGDGTQETVWRAEHFGRSTVLVQTPPLPQDLNLTGDGWRACWVAYQAINPGGYTGAGGGFEMQLILIVQ